MQSCWQTVTSRSELPWEDSWDDPRRCFRSPACWWGWGWRRKWKRSRPGPEIGKVGQMRRQRANQPSLRWWWILRFSLVLCPCCCIWCSCGFWGRVRCQPGSPQRPAHPRWEHCQWMRKKRNTRFTVDQLSLVSRYFWILTYRCSISLCCSMVETMSRYTADTLMSTSMSMVTSSALSGLQKSTCRYRQSQTLQSVWFFFLFWDGSLFYWCEDFSV